MTYLHDWEGVPEGGPCGPIALASCLPNVIRPMRYGTWGSPLRDGERQSAAEHVSLRMPAAAFLHCPVVNAFGAMAASRWWIDVTRSRGQACRPPWRDLQSEA